MHLMKNQRKKPQPLNIGRRTGVDVIKGKTIRREEDGIEAFNDYWTDSDSVCSNQTIQLIHSPAKTKNDIISENVSILDRDSVSFRIPPRSSMKKTRNPKTEEYEDENDYSVPEKSRMSRKKMYCSKDIGRRTGVAVAMGKNIRRLDDGIEMFEDYWTDQSTLSLPKTNNENISDNGSSFERESVSVMKIPRSPSVKETQNKRTGEYEDLDLDSSEEKPKRLEISRKKLHLSESAGKAAISMSKMTQTSLLLDKTGSNRTELPDSSNINSSLRRSSRLLTNISRTSNRKEDLLLSRADISTAKVSSSNEMESGRKATGEEESRVAKSALLLDEAEISPFKNITNILKTSYSKETLKNKGDLSDSESDSPLEISRVLSETSHIPNRRHLSSSREDINLARVSLSSKTNSATKIKDKKNSRIMTRTSHPLDETSISKIYSNETGKNKDDSSDSEKNSPVEISKKFSETSHLRSRREELTSSREDISAARVLLSNEIVSGKKSKDKRSSRAMKQIAHPLEEKEVSPFQNRTNTSKTSCSKEYEKNMMDSSDSERNSIEISRVLSETFHVSNRKEKLSLSIDDTRATRVSLSGKKESGKKAKDKRNSGVPQTSHPLDETEGSLFINKIYTPKRDVKETRKSKVDLSDNKRNSPVERSRVLSETSHVPNQMENLSSSRHDTGAARLSLSSKIESEKLAKSKRNSGIMVGSSHQLDKTKDSFFKNKEYTPKRSYPNETGKSKMDSSDNESNSPLKISRILSQTSPVLNGREELPLTREDTNVARISLSSKMESEKKDKKRNASITIHPLDEIESLPLKNMADSSESDTNSSIKRYSESLSKTLSSSNCKDDVKRNSSSRRSLQYATNSSEVHNQKKNISFRSDRHENNSDILELNLRENKEKQKTSMGKSPTAVKRKMVQTPDTLENSLSKTSHVQNEGKERSERNFSGNESDNHTAESFVLLNQNENISSRSDKNVNRPEIIASGQKEKDQDDNQESLSAEKSKVMESSTAQTSDSLKNTKVSNNAVLHKKTVSSKRSSKSKMVFSKTTKDALQENASSLCNLRGSSRMKFPPLASWRNERLKFVREKEEIICVGVDEGQKEDDFAIRTLKRKLESRPKKSGKGSSGKMKQKDFSKVLKKTPILNLRTQKTIELNLHRPFNTYEWTVPPNEENPGYMISRTFSSHPVTFGFIDIASHRMKDKQFSLSDNLHFLVVKGTVEVVIHETSFTFQKGDSFIVPVGTGYCISNNTSSNALLSFSSFKIPFFKHQEEED